MRQVVGRRRGMYPDVKNSSDSRSPMVGRRVGSAFSILLISEAATGLMCWGGEHHMRLWKAHNVRTVAIGARCHLPVESCTRFS